MAEGYELVRLRGGVITTRSVAYDESYHPGIGPQAEAVAVYVQALQIRERFQLTAGEFVVWDVGLGGAANALAVIEAVRERPGRLCLVSFDHTLAALEFALRHAGALGYFGALAPLAEVLLRTGTVESRVGRASISWQVVSGDFARLVASPVAVEWPKPHAILFDPHSPVVNTEMWTLGLFEGLFARLDPARPCALATYSRSTMLRVALLLAGFYVGAGCATGLKEETTVAANRPELVRLPLNARWLKRARRSKAAEPLGESAYRQAPLSDKTWERLRAHPQFVSLAPT